MMPSAHYPFIDLAVHDEIREAFASGAAIAVFAPNLNGLVWANGAAAELFGFETIYDFADAGLSAHNSVRRQIESTLGRLSQGPQNVSLRLASGFKTVVQPAAVKEIRLGDTPAVMLSCPVPVTARTDVQRAGLVIEGFKDTETHVAVIDAHGQIQAASPGFGQLEISNEICQAWVEEVATESDRLVKRPIATALGHLPAAIGRLVDEPASHLLFVVETAIGDMDDPDQHSDGLTDDEEPTPSDIVASSETGASFISTPPQSMNSDAELTPSTRTSETESSAATQDIFVTEEASSQNDAPIADTLTEDAQASVEAEQSGSTITPIVSEPWTEQSEGSDAEQNGETGDRDNPTAFEFDPARRPLRFVWRTNEKGRFTEISPEFEQALGPKSADFIGLGFKQIARRFGVDKEGVVRKLLKKRDTWSGKTVEWPAEGTSLVVPVDLAALPTYSRSREFDGFRGFGIIRVSDAKEDPDRRGLSLQKDDLDEDNTDLNVGVVPIPDALMDHSSSEPQQVATRVETPRKTGLLGVPIDDLTDDATSKEPENTSAFSTSNGGDDLSPQETQDGAPTDRELSAGESKSEPEALDISDNPGRRDSDKVIRLSEHLDTPRDGLSKGEEAAFREIGERLSRTFGRRNADDLQSDNHDDDAAENDVQEGSDEDGRSDILPSELNNFVDPEQTRPAPEEDADTDGEVSPSPSGTASADDVSDDETELSEENSDLNDVAASDAGGPLNAEAEQTKSAMDTSEADVANGDHGSAEIVASNKVDEAPAAEPVIPSAFALPARSTMPYGLNGSVLDELPVALLVHAGDTLHHANSEFLSMTGYEDLKTFEAAGGLDALFASSEELDQTSNTGRGTVVVHAVDGKSIEAAARLQSIRWLEGHALILALSPVKTDSGLKQPASVVTADRSSSEESDEDFETRIEALKIEAEELKSILETATDGVVIVGEDGTIRSMNSSAAALFNYDENDTQNQPFAMLFAHESQRAVIDYVSGLSDHGVASVLNDGREVIGRESSGGFLPLFMTIGRLSGSNGYCAVMRDITQWKNSEEELRSAKRAAETASSHKSEFLARVSHEIRTPLNAIIGFSEMMAEERFGPIGNPRYVEYAHDIGSSGKHVLDIVNDLLDISKIEAGELEMEFVAVQLNDVIAEAVSLLQPQANSQRLIIRTSLSSSVPDVVADARSIKQIALNLLANSIRFTPSGGQIVVSTAYEDSGSVILRIRDTGIGMSRAELDQALKPFKQVSPSSRKQGDGTGLGLPLTKAMVEANRADFEVETAPNEGTLVEISFPPQRVLAN